MNDLGDDSELIDDWSEIDGILLWVNFFNGCKLKCCWVCGGDDDGGGGGWLSGFLLISFDCLGENTDDLVDGAGDCGWAIIFGWELVGGGGIKGDTLSLAVLLLLLVWTLPGTLFSLFSI